MTDDAWERLRAADPEGPAARAGQAGDAAEDLDALRERVDALVGPDTEAEVGTEVEIAVTDLGAERARRSRRAPWWAAAAAAGVVVAGAGGYALGADTFGAVPSAADSGTGSATASVGIAPAPALAGPEDARASAGAAADSWAMPVGTGRTVFTASGLGDGPAAAPGWGLDATAAATSERAAQVAAAFGVGGEPRLEYGSWTVGAADYTGPTVSIGVDGSATLSYQDPALDPWTKCVDGPCAEPTGNSPRGDAATRLLLDTLTAIGVPTDDLRVTVDPSQDEGSVVTYASAEVLADGVATGLTWSAGLVEGGVQSLSGPLADVVPLGDYPVVSPDEAVARLMDVRFGTDGGRVVYPADARATAVPEGGATDEGSTGSGVTSPGSAGDTSTSSGAVAPGERAPGTPDGATAPPAPTEGVTPAWPVEQVTITGAEPGLSVQTQPDGSVLLLPTYVLTSDDGGSWTVLSVADGALDLAPSVP